MNSAPTAPAPAATPQATPLSTLSMPELRARIARLTVARRDADYAADPAAANGAASQALAEIGAEIRRRETMDPPGFVERPDHEDEAADDAEALPGIAVTAADLPLHPAHVLAALVDGDHTFTPRGWQWDTDHGPRGFDTADLHAVCDLIDARLVDNTPIHGRPSLDATARGRQVAAFRAQLDAVKAVA